MYSRDTPFLDRTHGIILHGLDRYNRHLQTSCGIIILAQLDRFSEFSLASFSATCRKRNVLWPTDSWFLVQGKNQKNQKRFYFLFRAPGRVEREFAPGSSSHNACTLSLRPPAKWVDASSMSICR